MSYLLIILISVSSYAALFDPKDEVFESMDRRGFSEQEYQALIEGADEDYFSEMDKGITLAPDAKTSRGEYYLENHDILFERLSPLFPDLSKEEIIKRSVKGRNNWMVYTGGNDKFWDYLNKFAFGGLDFLKTISNHPNASALRSERWEKLGLVNEPCFVENKGPRADRYGLWLDVRDTSCEADPFENSNKYPGVKIGSRGKDLFLGIGEVPIDYRPSPSAVDWWARREAKKLGVEAKKHEVGSSYGYATGVVGLRLFTNPDFDQKAAARWDAERYYNDPTYYNDPDLVKPYRVGMACAFCHVGPSPTNPPSDFNKPKWENLSSTVGSQYYWVDRVFFWNYKKEQENFIHQLLHSQRPGTLDTSLISSDQINNPRTMNAIYELRARVKAALDFGHKEFIRDDERLNKKIFEQDFVSLKSPLHALEGERQNYVEFRTNKIQESVVVPRILKDGADSVSSLGSLNRVYVNIGLFSEEWLRNFVPLLGTFDLPFFKITPFEIKKAQKNSGYWNANVEQTPDLLMFLLGAGSPDKLKDTSLAAEHLLDYDSNRVNRGKEVFAQRCASCHSSKLPQKAYSYFNKDECIGEGYLSCWNRYWNAISTDSDLKREIEEIVKSEDFLEDNFLSTDLRVPSSIVGTQVCSAVATNAIENDVWDNFSSYSYKSLPEVHEAIIYEPSLDAQSYVKRTVSLPGGGRGYLRPPSLVSIWTSAPYFNNNSLGPFYFEGTNDKRMESFEKSMRELLYPERRGRSKKYDEGEKVVEYELNGHKASGVVDVLQVDSFVNIPAAYVPSLIYKLIPDEFKEKATEAKEHLNDLVRVRSNMYSGDDADYVSVENQQDRIHLGPIPKGVPINLISNINTESNKADLIKAIFSLVEAINEAKKQTTEAGKLDAFMSVALEPLLSVSKCSDFIVNKGHYFGTKFEYKGARALSDEDKESLIEFVKHF